jgi:quinol monooxygenase YgiN
MYPIVELRQYTLHPGRRDELIELFDREFVETQEDAGMAVLGQFRDLRDPDKFVWLRGFADMPSRAEALRRFYGGPVWAAHSAAANATMIDSDDVLLLRPLDGGFPLPPARGSELPQSRFLATLHFADAPFETHPPTDLPPLAAFTTEYAENTFPALPIRAGEHVFVWFARFDDQAALDKHLAAADPATTATTVLELAPTARSLLR